MYVKKWVAEIITRERQPENQQINFISKALEWVRWVHRNLTDNHCEKCLKLDGCVFANDKAPPCPHHPFCHCLLEPISYAEVLLNARAVSSINKFVNYLFSSEYNKKNGKKSLFESWGYTVEDSEFLRKESEIQGLEKYLNGDYTLGKLDKYGQRINIRVSIPRRDTGETVSFITGWMVYPNGEISLNTPYGDK